MYGNTKDQEYPKQFLAKSPMLEASQYVTSNYTIEI
jgi:hypothetical protein